MGRSITNSGRIVFTLFIASTLFIPICVDYKDCTFERTPAEYIQSDYSNHPRIAIFTNTDFEDQGWPGNGTQGNPYRIEGLNITGSYSGIFIQDTDVFFVVRNCIVAANESGFAIDLSSVHNGVFEDCILVGSHSGIEMDWCSNITIDSCSSSDPIDAGRSDNIIVMHSVFTDGLTLSHCNDWVLNNNTIPTGTLHLGSCSNFNIIDNTLSNNGLYLGIWGAPPADVSPFYNHTITGNTVDDKPLLYLKGVSGSVISADTYGEIILFDCDGVSISGGEMTHCMTPIQVAYSSDCNISQVRLIDCNYGIYAIGAEDLVVHNCDVFSFGTAAVLCDYCSDVIIDDCDFQGTHSAQGVIVSDSISVIVTQCALESCNNYGVGVADSLHVLIDENVIEDCGQGIVLYSNNVSVQNNEVLESTRYGIYIAGNNSLITGNDVVHSEGIGIYIEENAHSNRIFDNSIGWNLGGNAQDNGTANEWDDGISLGNRWSDYSGAGVYNIDGTAGSVDHFPSALITGTSQMIRILMIAGVAGVVVVIVVIIYKKKLSS